MRHPALAFVLVLFTALFVSAPRAYADARSDAKAHYQAGVKAYSAGDYRTAIKEFSSAQQLMPADLNNYNLALCYDKLGEAEPAIQHYKAFLAKVPNADKRTEIEASIARLEGALKSAAAKRAEEARAAEEARKAEEARAAEEARKAAEAAKQPPVTPDATGTGATGTAGTAEPGTGTGDQPAGTGDQPIGVGSTGTPGSAQAVSTGDAQLDRAAAIDINQIRSQRIGMGTVDPGPAGAAGGAAVGQPGQGGADPGAHANAGATRPGTGAAPAPMDQPAPPKATPVYKKWWFWVVVAISAVVVYQIATEDSNAPNRARESTLPGSPRATSYTGMTLLRW